MSARQTLDHAFLLPVSLARRLSLEFRQRLVAGCDVEAHAATDPHYRQDFSEYPILYTARTYLVPGSEPRRVGEDAEFRRSNWLGYPIRLFVFSFVRHLSLSR